MAAKLKANSVDAIRNSASNACSLLKVLLCQLTQGEKNVGELEQSTNILQPTLSQQLTKLRQEKIVSTRKDGKFIYYNISSNEVIDVMRTLSGLYGCNTK